MNWRRWLGFDPAGKDSVIMAVRETSGDVFTLAGGGEIRVDPDRLRQGFHTRSTLDQITRQLAEYSPSSREGKPLPEKEKKRPLYLDDYQPRDTTQPAFRVFWERSFPAPAPLTVEEVERRNALFFDGRRLRDWVEYRNRHPGIRDIALGTLPPMRNAIEDLINFLVEIDQDLDARDLVAVELDVQHEPAEQVGLESQGWHYRIEALVVPSAVLATEQGQFDELQAKLKQD